ncbi:Uu.00g095050.m01.CDS01 [Anthostomella pinea]|uniref:Uu.00g095050.m01.CDS01 n=1 Tax=Anthostomella pinea TaxID=933095 RepID=A0AAI8YMY4_9PEZI|nr:Uu.00g095050.m01.CDS01 [Anthostomella pinea]
MEGLEIVRNVPKGVLYAIAPFVVVATLLSAVRLYTTWSYYQTMRQFIESPQDGKKKVKPPQIPYSLPWLGNSLQFLDPKPGHYWSELFAWHPRSTGVCTLLIGGKKTHILFSPSAVQALFKAKTPSRDVFEREMFHHVFGMPDEQIHNFEAGKHSQHEMNSQYLTKHERVNELTSHFTRVLEEVLEKDAREVVELEGIGLYEWLRDRMFTASTTALMGEKLLQVYPTYCRDFYQFDKEFLSFFFQLPKFMMGDALKNRDRIFDKLEEWSNEMHRLSGGSPVDPEGPAWEPLFGSRLNRARQLDYKNIKLNSRTAAALDLGITFGLASNVIPATGWVLMHLLDPEADPTILARVMEELRQAERCDGSLDIPTLVSQPLLQSVWTETLRLYTDVLVTRNCTEDLTLPVDEDGKRLVTFRKGDNIFAPSWLGHHDAGAWSGKAPYEQFYATRFYTEDPETGRGTFSMSGTTGKFFPFGGGRTICPGRVFAKQEGLGALAMILLCFDFEFKGFTGADKTPVDTFPGLARAFAGSGGLVPGGDIRVKVRRRQR